MTKEELEKHHKELSDIYARFDASIDRTKGGNAKTRKSAQYEVDIALMMFENYVNREGWDLYDALTGGGGGDNYFGMAIAWDEFKSQTWFGKDMPRFLTELRKTIANIKDEPEEPKDNKEPEEPQTKEAP